MTETLHEFSTGPYNVLEYSVRTEDGKVVIDLNDNDLGRITIENRETVDELREALNKAEEFFIEKKRRGEEL